MRARVEWGIFCLPVSCLREVIEGKAYRVYETAMYYLCSSVNLCSPGLVQMIIATCERKTLRQSHNAR